MAFFDERYDKNEFFYGKEPNDYLNSLFDMQIPLPSTNQP
jgi:hypothetical protein